ncbi:hypothetical protein [Hyphomicrobium sp. CS1GBMeth3]|uniref:hypothetical protein n=1 Tax=Hyphomicrobium sp. CS1GBMeth3 TaxID=1892845 RepID=UPI000AAFD2E9|nr:hypothetical protein [Hyphomicrobium sp. CS1GBMeth3]
MMRNRVTTSCAVRDAPPGGDERDIELLVNRFHISRRASVRRLVASSPRILDLAVTFPGALHMLAGRQPQRLRRKALDLVIGGAPLKDVAVVLELPLWLRRLPPEAFTGPISGVPNSETFARRIANHMPTSAENMSFWLDSVIFGARACDEYFALWLAQQAIFIEHGNPQRLFGLLAAYAWFSSADLARARGLIVVPWRPEMALDTAVCAAKSWLNRMRLVLQLGRGVLDDPWLKPGEARGFSFVPLLEHASILAEAHAMQNCSDQYADRLARDKCRLFSIRRRGVRVATLEIGPHPREPGVLAIAQLKARHNLPASAEAWQAAHTWMGTQQDLRRPGNGGQTDHPFDATTWTALMAPYRTHKDGAPWIPERASKESFSLIDSGIGELARRAGITSWLFT